jgi:hypothetical protein
LNYVADFSCGDMILKALEDGTYSIFAVDARCVGEPRVNLGEEFFPRPYLSRLPGRTPHAP